MTASPYSTEMLLSAATPRCPLTPRELEVLTTVAEGRSNAEAARLFGLSSQTVKNHLARIMGKLRAPDRTAAVVVALRNRWILLDQLDVQEREATAA